MQPSKHQMTCNFIFPEIIILVMMALHPPGPLTSRDETSHYIKKIILAKVNRIMLSAITETGLAVIGTIRSSASAIGLRTVTLPGRNYGYGRYPGKERSGKIC